MACSTLQLAAQPTLLGRLWLLYDGMRYPYRCAAAGDSAGPPDAVEAAADPVFVAGSETSVSPHRTR